MNDGSRDGYRDLDELVRALQAAGSLRDEEGLDVSILDHGLQCASRLRREHPDDVELQVAGLVHDLGWLEPDADGGFRVRPDAEHDRVGAVLVRSLLGDRVADLVGGHVDAKRYLVAVEPGYAGVLSTTSTTTLGFQGGAMSPAEVEEFAARGDAESLVALRRADDAAKVPGARVAPLDDWLVPLAAACGAG